MQRRDGELVALLRQAKSKLRAAQYANGESEQMAEALMQDVQSLLSTALAGAA